jgi:CDP-glucose 4,6-dehydratase
MSNNGSTSLDFWRGRPVFVTGATGLLGGWLVRALLEAGAEVIALIRDGAPNSLLVREGWITRINTVNGSLSDSGTMRRVLAEYSIDTVFHLAAQTLVGVAKTDPVGTLEANIQGTWNLLEAARQCGTRQIIVASSDKAYGSSTSLPYLETHALEGRYPYDCSKSCVDLISQMYAATYNLPAAIVRCGNLFGGGDLNFSRTVPGVIQSAIQNERFQIRSDGKFVRDFLYVEDAALAYLCLAEALAADRALAGEAFNFSLEVRYNVLEIVNMVLKMMGRSDLEPVILNKASAEIREQYMSSAKARQRLQWAPRYGMEEGLRRTIAWYLQYFGAAGKPAALEAVGSV